jgi:hypothetical protein
MWQQRAGAATRCGDEGILPAMHGEQRAARCSSFMLVKLTQRIEAKFTDHATH